MVPGRGIAALGAGLFLAGRRLACVAGQRWIASEKTDYGYGAEDALRFLTRLTRYLGIGSDTILPGYEDVLLLPVEGRHATR